MKLEDKIDAFFSRPDIDEIIERSYIYEYWKKDNKDYLKRFYYEKFIKELNDIIEASHRTDTFDFEGTLQLKINQAKSELSEVERHIKHSLKENGINCF